MCSSCKAGAAHDDVPIRVEPNVVVISPTQVPEQRFVCYALLYGRVWRVVSTARRRGPRPIPPPQVVSSGLRDSPELELYISRQA